MVIKRSTRATAAATVKAPAASPAKKKKRAAKAARPDGYGSTKPAGPRERTSTPLPSLSLGEKVQYQAEDLPENQPTARFAGQPPALKRPADPLPSFLGGPLKKHSRILGPDPTVPWRAKSVMNPTAITRDGKIYLLVRAQDTSGA